MIVIPMAGLSRRFTEAGYGVPKYMLPLEGGTVFDHAVGSFRAYFEVIPFLFVARADSGTREFVSAACARLGIADFRVLILDRPTGGQAETVSLGLRAAQTPGETPVTIFNIDTFRSGFSFPSAAWWSASSGYLEVFRGGGANWSYVKAAPGLDALVAETAEKVPISDLCCTGLYHFAAYRDFQFAFDAECQRPTAAELYVAPLYNHLIADGRSVHFHLVGESEIVFCGVPAEYEALAGSDKSTV